MWEKLVAQGSLHMEVTGPTLSSSALINNVFRFLINRENSLIGFAVVIPANRIKKVIRIKNWVLPSNQLYEGQVISQGHKLLPTSIYKPIAMTLKLVLVVEMCTI